MPSGISSHLTVFTGAPRVTRSAGQRRGRPRTRLRMVHARQPRSPCARCRGSCRPARGARSPGETARSRHAPPASPRSASRRPTSGGTPGSPPRSGCSAKKKPGAKPRLKYYFVASARHGVAAGAGALGASTLGHRAAIPGTQKRTRARSLRRPQLSRLATSCRPDRRRACLHSTRTPAPRSGPALTFPGASAPSSRKSSPRCSLPPSRGTCIGWNRRNEKLQLRI